MKLLVTATWAPLTTLPAQRTKKNEAANKQKLCFPVSVARNTHVFLLTETAKKIKRFHTNGALSSSAVR